MKKFLNKKWLPYIVFLCYLILVHLSDYKAVSDDTRFVNIFGGNITEALQNRYTTWSSRVLIEYVLAIIINHSVFLWKVCNITMSMLILFSLDKIFLSKENGNSVRFILVVLLIFYPVGHMGSAGYITTTINYLWPLATMLYSFIILKKLYYNEKIYFIEGFIYLVCAIFGANQEQYAPAMIVTFVIALLLMLYKKRFNIWLCLINISCITELVLILSCPGNTNRLSSETGRFMSAFESLSFFEKVRLGYITTIAEFVENSSNVFLLFGVIFAICMFKKTKNVLYRIIPLAQLSYIFIFSFNHAFEGRCLRRLLGTNDISSLNFMGFSWVLRYALYLLLSCLILLGFYYYFDSLKEFFLASCVYCLAIGSRMILGFSPTLYASSTRTFLIMYAGIIICTLLILINRNKGIVKEWSK